MEEDALIFSSDIDSEGDTWRLRFCWGVSPIEGAWDASAMEEDGYGEEAET
jgi:hypothetical protein